jgi:hypothetical protein
MAFKKELLKNIEAKVGLSIDDIKSKTPGELRAYFRKKSGKQLKFPSRFPAIGRGNVLRDSVKTTKEIDEEIDRILAH